MNTRANQKWTFSEVEEARSVIASLNSKYRDYDGEYHDNIIGELQAKFPSKTMHQVRDLYVDLVVEMDMMQCEEKEYGGANGVIHNIDGHVNNYGVPEEREVSMDGKDILHGFPLKHVGIVETMKKVPVVKDNNVEVLENKMPVHQPVVERSSRNFWTIDEHRLFLRGLSVYGRGKWKEISKNFVTSRTPLQISSHAQKYFKRLQKGSERQRYSINDVELENNDRMNLENNARPSQNIGQFKFPF